MVPQGVYAIYACFRIWWKYNAQIYRYLDIVISCVHRHITGKLGTPLRIRHVRLKLAFVCPVA